MQILQTLAASVFYKAAKSVRPIRLRLIFNVVPEPPIQKPKANNDEKYFRPLQSTRVATGPELSTPVQLFSVIR